MTKIPLTAPGAQRLREELQRLKSVERPRIINAIAEARAHGDLKEEQTGDEVSYQIVGDLEADIKQGRISVSSPIARALIGKEEGDVAVVKAPGGDRGYEIVAVRYHCPLRQTGGWMNRWLFADARPRPRGLLVAERLLLAVWVGGMLAVGYLAVPVLFHMLDDRVLAGALAGEMFRYMNGVGLVCSALTNNSAPHT